MKILLRTAPAVLFLFTSPASAQDASAIAEAVAAQAEWRLEAPPVAYAPDSLETLVGEAAPVVLGFGFRGAATMAFVAEGRVEAALFEMLDSTAAYGLFTRERDWSAPGYERLSVGTEAYRTGGRTVVWHSRYVVRLDGPREATLRLAEALATHLGGASQKPPVHTHLPAAGLASDSERYILAASEFESELGLSAEALGFENSVEAAVATYRRGNATARLALLQYPTQHLAGVFAESWAAGAENAPPHQRSGPLLAIVLDSDSPELTQSVLEDLRYQSEVTWDQPPGAQLTLAHMILTIFSWIGLALLFTTAAGVSYGAYRIYMKNRFPEHAYGADPEGQFIQLKLDQQVRTRELPR